MTPRKTMNRNDQVVPHRAVMVGEMLDAIVPKDGGIYVDGTFGAGGWSRALLAAAACHVYAIDRDATAIEGGQELARDHRDRLTLMIGPFGDLERLLASQGIERVDGVALDLGVSSMQLDDAGRGFSFRHDAPLDMRMGQEGPTAEDLVNTASAESLADLISTYGEERRAWAVARAIVAARAETRITRTEQLADIVRGVVRPSGRGIDPATRTFQALRIFINDELGELDRGLAASERVLKPGGRLAVLSFHSLEDRRVKGFLQGRAGGAARPSRHVPSAATKSPDPSFRLLFRGVRKPNRAEIAANPRARSARLRAAERTGAPPWPHREAA